MREPTIFRDIAVSLLRPVIGSNVEIDVVALNWVADVRKQIAAAFKWLYKYFTSSSTVSIENSTFTSHQQALGSLENTSANAMFIQYF